MHRTDAKVVGAESAAGGDGLQGSARTLDHSTGHGVGESCS